MTTSSPAHLEGDWDEFGACPKTLEDKLSSTQLGKFRLEALDATKLSLMRPDGHLGPRTHPFPLAKRVQNDCVHGCLPGPIETCLE